MPAQGHPSEQDLAELVRQVALARGGDARAAGWLYDRYQRRVLRLCLSFAAIEPADAQDLVQEVFLRAWRGLAGLREPDRFEGWLLAIARRRCLTHLGKLGRRRQAQERWAAEQRLSPGAGCEEDAVRQLRIQVVGEEIERLSDSSLKQVGRLFYQQGCSCAQIAEQLAVPQSTVTTWLSRFRARIRRRLVARLLELRSPGTRRPA